jgi:hypothetical protein
MIPIKMVAFNLKLHKKMNVKFERLESAPIDFLKKNRKEEFLGGSNCSLALAACELAVRVGGFIFLKRFTSFFFGCIF